jgi:hypothetical protein
MLFSDMSDEVIASCFDTLYEETIDPFGRAALIDSLIEITTERNSDRLTEHRIIHESKGHFSSKQITDAYNTLQIQNDEHPMDDKQVYERYQKCVSALPNDRLKMKESLKIIQCFRQSEFLLQRLEIEEIPV